MVACATIWSLLPIDGANAAVIGASRAGATAVAPAPVVAMSATHLNAATNPVPNTDIKKKSGETEYQPTAINTSFYGPTEKKCTTKRLGVTFTNATKKTVNVTYKGSLFESIPSGAMGGACFHGTDPRTFVFGLEKSSSQLTVSASS
jgi:hypothetical protein